MEEGKPEGIVAVLAMRVFLDTNVLVSNFMWGGICAQVVEETIAGHTLVTGEAVLDELERVLTEKFDVPTDEISQYISILRHYHIEPQPEQPYEIPIDDPSDPWILASPVNAEANFLVTGDKPFRSADSHVDELLIRSPREFLEMVGE